ncbi:hypothetical protein ACTPOK_07095 [Streptomyces inhibens]|uniref:hypothetical protein n=1 Tax=Streptomyces inhibens TaxID=2293571 RepID=UPI00402B017F
MTTTDDVKLLLAATATREGDLDGAIGTIGAERTARLLTEELVFRSGLDELPVPEGESASATLVFPHDGRSLETTVSVTPKGAVLDEPPGEQDQPPTVITQQLTEVAGALYGPTELVTGATRTVRWPAPEVVVPGVQRRPLPTAFYAVVQRLLRSLDRKDPADLTELAVRYGTDKWSALHQYPQHYERHFGPLRDRALTILEIGIGGYDDRTAGGQSLRMWKRYFPRSVIHGLDIEDKSLVDQARVITVRGDQSDAGSLTELAECIGPFDIIIDDGSHLSPHVITSFHTLFPYLRPHGLYVVEDLHASYWKPLFDGSDRDLADPAYSVGFLKTLVDGLHHEEILTPDARIPQPTDQLIKGLHFYHNLAFIEKGPNVEGSPIAELLRNSAARENH